MAKNDISDAIEYVGDKSPAEIKPTAEKNANLVILDSSTPSVRSIVRVVLVTLVILFFAGFVQNIISSLTYLFFLIILSVFFAYLIKPLVELIRRPFENISYDRYMPQPLAIAAAYIIVFSTLGIAVAVLSPRISEQAKQLSISLPSYASSIQNSFKDISKRYERFQIPDAVQFQIN